MIACYVRAVFAVQSRTLLTLDDLAGNAAANLAFECFKKHAREGFLRFLRILQVYDPALLKPDFVAILQRALMLFAVQRLRLQIQLLQLFLLAIVVIEFEAVAFLAALNLRRNFASCLVFFRFFCLHVFVEGCAVVDQVSAKFQRTEKLHIFFLVFSHIQLLRLFVLVFFKFGLLTEHALVFYVLDDFQDFVV